MDDNQFTNGSNEQSSESINFYSNTGKELDSQVYYSQPVIEEPQNNDNNYGNNDKKQKKPSKKGFGSTMMKCAALALVFGLVSGTIFYGTGFIFDYARGDEPAASQVSLEEKPPAVVDNSSDVIPVTNVIQNAADSDASTTVENVMPSVVSITNMTQIDMSNYRGFSGFGGFEEFFPQYGEEGMTQEQESSGSGIIISKTDKEYYVVTNNHVIEDATTISVTFINNEIVSAEVKGTDPDTDLAVISIPIENISEEALSQIKVASLGDSDALKVGQSVIAIGNALGYGQSVTRGVVSALDREVTVMNGNQSITNELIQTDAAINPGNSGGALLNINGEVIGINSVKYASADVEGMGYAIPISNAQPIIKDLIEREKVEESQTAYLGISGISVTEEASVNYNMPLGVFVESVSEGSAAGNAGILQGDIITQFDGKEIKSMEKLKEQLTYYKAGTEVEMTLQRVENGQYNEYQITVTLGKKS